MPVRPDKDERSLVEPGDVGIHDPQDAEGHPAFSCALGEPVSGCVVSDDEDIAAAEVVEQ
jgi:hypothetical protein